MPLMKTIMKQHKYASGSTTDATASDPSSTEGAVVASVLRQIRPVSFKYKSQSEAKYSRYGFIAQELEAVLPSVIHTAPDSGMKAVNYNDMIAVLALGIQSIDSRVVAMAEKVKDLGQKQENYYLEVSDRLHLMESLMKKVVQDVGVDQVPDAAKELGVV